MERTKGKRFFHKISPFERLFALFFAYEENEGCAKLSFANEQLHA